LEEADEQGHGIILVVEDDEAVRSTTVAMLRDLGFSTIEAATAKSALSVLDSGTVIDLVFSDVIMPGGMNGIELKREMGLRRHRMPVLLTSGYTAQKIIPEELAGEVHVLRKPYSQFELARSVREAMQRDMAKDRGATFHSGTGDTGGVSLTDGRAE